MTQHDNSICTLDQLLSYEELCTLETALCLYNPRNDEMEIAKGLKKKLGRFERKLPLLPGSWACGQYTCLGPMPGGKLPRKAI